jgi:xylulokinase
MSFVGLDIGTSGLKAIVINRDGYPIASTRRAYAQSSPRPGWYELESELVSRAMMDALTELAGRTADAGDPIEALSMSLSANEATAVDARGEVVAPTIMSMDSRGTDTAAWWERTVGRQQIFARTGIRAHPMHALPRLGWIRSNEPEVFARTKKYLTWGQFLQLRLGVGAELDPSMACATMAFDLVAGDWSDDQLTTAGLDSRIFGDVVPTGTPVGTISGAVARETGLPRDVTVAVGGFDQAMAALGAGQLDPGDAGVGTGSWEALTVLTATPQLDEALLASGYNSARYVLPGRFYSVANNSGGGSVLQWFVDTLGQPEAQRAAQSGEDPFALLLDAATPTPSGLLLLPHFAGSYNPWMDPEATGVILGLRLSTTRADLVKAIVEGITFEFRENLTRLESAGLSVDSLVATGGGAKSDYWIQLRADLVGKPVHTVNVKETGAFAAACLAGASTRAFDSTEAAVREFVRTEKVFQPDVRRGALYDDLFAAYRLMYPALRGVHPGTPTDNGGNLREGE